MDYHWAEEDATILVKWGLVERYEKYKHEFLRLAKTAKDFCADSMFDDPEPEDCYMAFLAGVLTSKGFASLVEKTRFVPHGVNPLTRNLALRFSRWFLHKYWSEI